MSNVSKTIGEVVDVSEETNVEIKEKLCNITKQKDCVLMALIASYVGVKVTPSKTSRAQIGILEEFALETAIEKIKQSSSKTDKLYLLLNSPGGIIQSSYKVARALRNNFKEITVFIPHIAASGGTLIAITGNEIIMGMMSQLTPLDPIHEINGKSISANSIIRSFDHVTEFFSDKSPEDAPYTYKILAENFEAEDIDSALSIMELMKTYIIELLKGSGYKDEKAKEIADKLVRGYLDHGEVITIDKAKKLGLNVTEHTKYPEVWDIFRDWLSAYILQSTDKHIIRYVVPNSVEKNKKEKSEKDKSKK